MLHSMTSFVPRVAPGAGAELSDKFAGRLVDRWLDRIFQIEENTLAKMRRFLGNGGIGGTPKAQTKFADRLRAEMKDVLLHSALQTGKRAKFKFSFDALLVAPHEDNSNPWLMVNRAISTKDGPAHRTVHSEFTVAAFTRHALIRAVQRLGTETTDDLLATVRAAWPAIIRAELITRDTRRDGDAWLVPFRAPGLHRDDFGVALMASVGEDKFFVAKTFLTSDQLGLLDQFDPCLRLLNAINPDAGAGVPDDTLETLAPLVEACRTRRS